MFCFEEGAKDTHLTKNSAACSLLVVPIDIFFNAMSNFNLPHSITIVH